MKAPDGFVPVVNDLQIGLNSWMPNEDGYIRFTDGHGLVSDVGNVYMTVGSKRSGTYASISLSRQSFQKLVAAEQANIKILRTLFKPTGVRLVPADGTDPILVPEGNALRLVGDMLSIMDEDGNELRTVAAAEYDIEWVAAPPAKQNDDDTE